LYGLSRRGPFAERWSRGSIQPEETFALAEQLRQEGGYAWTQAAADDLTRQALEALEKSQPEGQAGEALRALTHRLLSRKS
jgi:geranylgeranyl pyrophosphate synthase